MAPGSSRGGTCHSGKAQPITKTTHVHIDELASCDCSSNTSALPERTLYMEACCISRQGASPPDIQLALEAKSSNNSQAFLFHARIDLVKDGDMIEQLNCGTQAVTPAAVFWAFVFCGQSAQTIWHASLMTWGVIQRVCGRSCGSRQGYINVFSGTGALTSAHSDQLAQFQVFFWLLLLCLEGERVVQECMAAH